MSILNSWGFFAFIVAFISGLGAAVVCYLLLNWTHIRVLLGLDYRLSDLEARVNREVKVRASEASRAGKNWDKEMLDKIQADPEKPKLTLENWRNSKFKV